MKRVTLPGGTTTPALGIGSWRLGESRAARKTDVASLRTAIAQGYRLFDTAEMDGEGGAGSVLGEALHAAFDDAALAAVDAAFAPPRRKSALAMI